MTMYPNFLDKPLRVSAPWIMQSIHWRLFASFLRNNLNIMLLLLFRPLYSCMLVTCSEFPTESRTNTPGPSALPILWQKPLSVWLAIAGCQACQMTGCLGLSANAFSATFYSECQYSFYFFPPMVISTGHKGHWTFLPDSKWFSDESLVLNGVLRFCSTNTPPSAGLFSSSWSHQ